MRKKSIGLIIGAALFSTILPGMKANAEVLGNINSVQAIQATAQNGWVSISGKSYFYKDNTLVKGWLEDNNAWYLLDSNDGHMLTGWQQVNGAWYLLDSTYGYMKKDWQEVDGKYYLLDSTYGYMKTGWQQVNGTWYLLDSIDGYMKKGWQQVDGKWYFLDTTYGYMKTGWQKIDGKEYYFWPSSGSMATDTTVDGKYLGKDGAYVAQTQADKVIAEARAHMPLVTYVYGADDAARHIFDCSSFTKHIFSHQGISLGRSTWNQMDQGVEVSQANLRAGDLVFTLGGNHVGIYTSNGKMIHNSMEGVNVIESNITNFYTARRVL